MLSRMHVESLWAPLFVLAGAPGAGKTTLLPHLIRAARGPVIMDMDELLEDGALLGVPIAVPEAAPVWPAYDRMWVKITTMTRRAGHPVVLLCPGPGPDEVETSRRAMGEPVYFALLDCPDDVRRDRLRPRGWSDERLDEAVDDAAQARRVFPTVFDSDAAEPAALAQRILSWVTDTCKQQ